MNNIPLIATDIPTTVIQQLSQKWGFEIRQFNDSDMFILEMTTQRLQLHKRIDEKFDTIYADFVMGTNAHRRKFGGGKKQAIASAIGLKKGATPSVVDATAGLGADAFILCALGCRVHMIERSAVIAALLEDGLSRAKLDSKIRLWVNQRLSFAFHDSCTGLTALPFKPDVVYLDPMFPKRKRTALAKKKIQIFQSLVGADEDADDLLDIALKTAKNRVVVKRPEHADFLANQKPDTSIKTKRNRFDLYLIS